MPKGMCQRSGRRGFTLIELLVVIGIIVILVGILLPVVSTMRKRAQIADTTAELDKIATACHNYYQDFRAFPGPIAESQIYGNNNTTQTVTGVTGLTIVSSSQNLVLGLSGGISAPTSATTTTLIYTVPTTTSQGLIGKGPQSLNYMAPQQNSAYFDATAAELANKGDGTLTSWTVTQGTGYASPALSAVPEYLDHFSNPHPIIYLRAVVGAGGFGIAVCDIPRSGSSPGSQYFTLQMAPYWRYYPNGINNLSSPTAITSSSNPISTKDANGTAIYTTPSTFFMNPTINDTFTPRNKDAFMLISAGYDGIYGTADDVIIPFN